MQITGYQLQAAIREATATRDLAASQWDASLYVFEGETGASPVEVMARFRVAEMRLAQLQELQQDYNSKVGVSVEGSMMTLSRAIKLVGGAGRAEKMWRTAAAGRKERGAYYDDKLPVRDAGQIRAVRTVTVEEATRYAKASLRYAASLREAIQSGNAIPIEFKDVDPTLFAG